MRLCVRCLLLLYWWEHFDIIFWHRYWNQGNVVCPTWCCRNCWSRCWCRRSFNTLLTVLIIIEIVSTLASIAIRCGEAELITAPVVLLAWMGSYVRRMLWNTLSFLVRRFKIQQNNILNDLFHSLWSLNRSKWNIFQRVDFIFEQLLCNFTSLAMLLKRCF